MPEIQDLYDVHRNPTGEKFLRGEQVPEGRYRLGVQVWIRNDEGKFLLSQRHPRKKKPLIWEPTGGAVDAGEDTRSAGVREVLEEIGLRLKPEQLTLIRTKLCDGIEFLDSYLVNWNGDVSELCFQENEVVDARWTTYEEMEALAQQGVFEAEYSDLFGLVRRTPAAISIMTIDDYDDVIRLWRSVPGMGLNDVDDSREGIGRYLARNPNTCFAAKTGRGLVGCILAGHDGRRGYLYHAAVLPEMQGSGIGHALVQSALNALKNEGISKAGMMVFKNNVSANRYWDRFGFSNRTDVNYRSMKLIDMNEMHT